jgi:hypothetical protein
MGLHLMFIRCSSSLVLLEFNSEISRASMVAQNNYAVNILLWYHMVSLFTFGEDGCYAMVVQGKIFDMFHILFLLPPSRNSCCGFNMN